MHFRGKHFGGRHFAATHFGGAGGVPPTPSPGGPGGLGFIPPAIMDRPDKLKRRIRDDEFVILHRRIPHRV